MSASITVRDVMTREFVGVSEGDEVVSTARLLLAEGAECAVAMRGREPVGLLTERDLLAWFLDDEPQSPDSAAESETDASDAAATVGDVMSTPVRTVPADDTVAEASREMSRRGVRWLVATDDEPIGVVTAGDLVTASTLAPGIDAAGTDVGVATATGSRTDGRSSDATGSESDPDEFDGYSTQGVCEACGALADDLADLNGRLLCANCRGT